MRPKCEEYVVEIAEFENRRFENKFNIGSLTTLNREARDGRVSDSPDVYRVDGYSPEDDCIIILSNPRFPDYVSEAVRRTNAAASSLAPVLRKHILQPTITGNYGVQSYAFWPRQKVISNNRLIRRVQLMTVNNSVFMWLCDVAKSTKTPVEPGEETVNLYVDPLTFLVDQDYVPSVIKRIASDTLDLLDTSDFLPVSILQHGDFWYGNILLDRSWPFSLVSSGSFYVIDWAGANIKGYPFVDQLRYLMSLGQRENAVSYRLDQYSRQCGIPLQDILSYICAYSGHLGMNRNEFPLDRYLELIETLIARVSDLAASQSKRSGYSTNQAGV